MTPLDVLHKAMAWVNPVFRTVGKGPPGEIIGRLTPEEREILKGLRSEDIRPGKVPYYGHWGGNYQAWDFEQDFRRRKEEFDRTVLKLVR